jgi:hypothetical protein
MADVVDGVVRAIVALVGLLVGVVAGAVLLAGRHGLPVLWRWRVELAAGVVRLWGRGPAGRRAALLLLPRSSTG